MRGDRFTKKVHILQFFPLHSLQCDISLNSYSFATSYLSCHLLSFRPFSYAIDRVIERRTTDLLPPRPIADSRNYLSFFRRQAKLYSAISSPQVDTYKSIQKYQKRRDSTHNVIHATAVGDSHNIGDGRPTELHISSDWRR